MSLGQARLAHRDLLPCAPHASPESGRPRTPKEECAWCMLRAPNRMSLAQLPLLKCTPTFSHPFSPTSHGLCRSIERLCGIVAWPTLTPQRAPSRSAAESWADPPRDILSEIRSCKVKECTGIESGKLTAAHDFVHRRHDPWRAIGELHRATVVKNFACHIRSPRFFVLRPLSSSPSDPIVLPWFHYLSISGTLICRIMAAGG
jgi:hypothetical protein